MELKHKVELIKDYRDNETLRASFNSLAKETFGIDFEPWHQKGFWNDSYICYSFKVGDRIVANASANRMHLKWDNKSYSAIQIGTVMTTPDYRKQGLAYKLLETIVKEWESEVDFIYLFGNDNALELYKKFDMHEFNEHRFFAKLPDQKKSDIRKLDLNDVNDYKLMVEMTRKRVAQSDAIGIEEDSHLVMFYCHQWFADKLYYIESKHAILVMEEQNEMLHIYDVISEAVQEMEVILTMISVEKAEKVEFHFKPELCKLPIEQIPLVKEDQTLLIRHKGLEPKESFRFSEFSHA
ncbi:MAG: GNAT family N-acetyltransferase [Clostridiales bacterium]|nr:GNAT family N-acetyltransferase [Clostridiales bacterium]